MGDDASPAQVTTGIPGKVVVNGATVEPSSLREPTAQPSEPQPQAQQDWQPQPYQRPQRPREPTGPLAPIEKLEPAEESLSAALGNVVLAIFGLAALVLLVHWFRGG
jgi:hypothetical protein